MFHCIVITQERKSLEEADGRQLPDGLTLPPRNVSCNGSLSKAWAVESLQCTLAICAQPNKVVIYAHATKPGEEQRVGVWPGIPGDQDSCCEMQILNFILPSIIGDSQRENQV